MHVFSLLNNLQTFLEAIYDVIEDIASIDHHIKTNTFIIATHYVTQRNDTTII